MSCSSTEVKMVFVSGCFDMLHSGHVQFFQQAAAYGDSLTVALGSDVTITRLKGRPPVNNEAERLFMVENCKCVTEAFVSRGTGYLDFEPELRRIRPHVFVVNTDGGDRLSKQKLCAELGIEYVVLNRVPKEGLVARSTTDLRAVTRIPFRIDLAGGWLDQPFVSKLYPGSVITLSLDPSSCNSFNDRSGMASSTRKTAIDLWGNQLPTVGDPEKLARILFCCDNPPGKDRSEISGAQDSIGIVYSGLALSTFDGDYWPRSIAQDLDMGHLKFVEDLLHLIPLGPRQDDYNVLSETNITDEGAKALAHATEKCWQAIVDQNAAAFGRSVKESFEAQISMFPLMMNSSVEKLIDRHRNTALGWKISGAGGGGYFIVVSEVEVPGSIRIRSRQGIA